MYSHNYFHEKSLLLQIGDQLPQFHVEIQQKVFHLVTL